MFPSRELYWNSAVFIWVVAYKAKGFMNVWVVAAMGVGVSGSLLEMWRCEITLL